MRLFFAIKRFFVNTKLQIDIGIAEAIRDKEIERINNTRKAVLETCGVDEKFILNADYNAAINIFTRGHRGSACGDADTSRVDEARTTCHAQA